MVLSVSRQEADRAFPASSTSEKLGGREFNKVKKLPTYDNIRNFLVGVCATAEATGKEYNDVFSLRQNY